MGTNDNSSRYRMGGTWNFGNADLVDGSTGEKVDLSKLGFILANGKSQSAEFPSALVEPLTKQNYKERMSMNLKLLSYQKKNQDFAFVCSVFPNTRRKGSAANSSKV
jgi:hypothetical protein